MKKSALLLLTVFVLCACESTYYPRTNPVYQSSSVASSNRNESTEFQSLMVKDQLDKNRRGAAVVTQLINDAPEDSIAALVFENQTDCNIIIRIVGAKNYILPVPKNDKNYLIVEKENYTISSYLCNSRYNVRKTVDESVTIKLGVTN